jgi:hypothetical protein
MTDNAFPAQTHTEEPPPLFDPDPQLVADLEGNPRSVRRHRRGVMDLAAREREGRSRSNGQQPD